MVIDRVLECALEAIYSTPNKFVLAVLGVVTAAILRPILQQDNEELPDPKDPDKSRYVALLWGILIGQISSIYFPVLTTLALVLSWMRQVHQYFHLTMIEISMYIMTFDTIVIAFWVLKWFIKASKRLELASLRLTFPGSLLAFSAGTLVFPTLICALSLTLSFLPFATLGIPLLLAVYLFQVPLRTSAARQDPAVRFYLEYRREFGYPKPEEAPALERLVPLLKRLGVRPEYVLERQYVQRMMGRVHVLSSLERSWERSWDSDGAEVEDLIDAVHALLALVWQNASEGEFWEVLGTVVWKHGFWEVYAVMDELSKLEVDHPEVRLARAMKRALLRLVTTGLPRS